MSCSTHVEVVLTEIKDGVRYLFALQRANNILGMSLLVLSMAAILLAMTIYSCFVTLQCMRVTVIKNFLMAVLFQEHINLVLHVLLYFARSEKLPDTRCLFWRTSFCEAIVVASKYFELASQCWLVVVLFHQWTRSTPTLHNRFSFCLFSLVGWLVPAVPTATWAGLMVRQETSKCWHGYNDLPEVSILEGVKLLAILLSLTLLVLSYFNLYNNRQMISVDEVLKKRQQSHLGAAVWVWLTLAQVVFTFTYHAPYPLDQSFMTAFSYSLTVLKSSAGLVVALCLCFLDGDVRDTLSLRSSPVLVTYQAVGRT